MIFWLSVVFMLAVVILSLLIPLAKNRPSRDVLYSVQYREKLSELEARLEESPNDDGLIAERVQVARDLLASSQRERDRSLNNRQVKLAAGLVLATIPASALGVYAYTGSPNISDVPLAARLAQSGDVVSMDVLVQKAEIHLKSDPDDLRGWTILARVYGTQGQNSKRRDALRQIIRIDGPNADRLADLAEAEILIDGSLVSGEARAMLDQALAIQPQHRKARYYRTIAMEQSGEFDAALVSWNELKSASPEDDQWQKMVNQRIARLQDFQAKSSDRNEMIEGMVSGLRDRLLDEPDDLEGWERLFRSYTVLKRPEQAVAAANEALSREDLNENLRSRLIKLRDDRVGAEQ